MELEQPELESEPIWDACDADCSFASYATLARLHFVLKMPSLSENQQIKKKSARNNGIFMNFLVKVLNTLFSYVEFQRSPLITS